jgi:hypothetical protein
MLVAIFVAKGHMLNIMRGSPPNRNVPLFVCGAILAIAGIGCLIFLRREFLFHTIGLSLILIAVLLIGKSNFHNSDRVRNANHTVSFFQKLKSLGLIVWAIGFALVVSFVASVFAMQLDAAAGGGSAIPADVFFGLVWVALAYMAYLFYRLR